MEDNRLVRVFDHIRLSPEREEAMLADLLCEKEEVSSMKQNRKRRIPAAALVAAVLVIALAGTALAAGYFGRVEINLLDDYGGLDGREGYAVNMPDGCIPVESLSEEVLAAYPEQKGDSDTRISFASRSDAGAFLGLTLANNAELEQVSQNDSKSGEKDKTWHNCIMNISYSPEKLPTDISLCTSYGEANCLVCEIVEWSTDAALPGFSPETGISVPSYGETDFQEYVTPTGMEVAVYSDVVTNTYSTGTYDYTTYMAHFIKDNALFTVQVFSNEAWKIHREGQEFLDPWETLTEILDAYE